MDALRRFFRRVFLTTEDAAGRPVYTHGPFVRRMILAYILTNVLVVALAAWQWNDTRHQEDTLAKQCIEQKVNREAIRASIKQSFINLGYRWEEVLGAAVKINQAPLKYYRQNPGEIRPQLLRLTHSLRTFPPIRCDHEEIRP